MMNKLASTVVVIVVSLVFFGACTGEADIKPPTLSLDVDSHETFTANQDRVRIELRADDPQQMDLEFEMIEGPAEAEFYTFRDSAVFNWTPHAGDITDGDPHRLVFAVTNEGGKTAQRTVHIDIVGTAGAIFTNSASQLYDPSSGEPIQFEVAVRHDEAAQVELSMPTAAAPDGATFEQVEDFRGEFRWQPTPGQREQRIHTVIFEAYDYQEVYDQEVTIIFQNVDPSPGTGSNGSGAVCDGDNPIDHKPIEVGRGSSDYDVQAQVVDSSRNWQEAVVYWTYDDPLVETPGWESSPLQIDGDQLTGQIPNPLVSADQAVDISYSLCVFDDTGDDEGVICAPEEFFFRFTAYSPDQHQCLSSNDGGVVSTTDWEPFRVCQDSSNIHLLEVEQGQLAEVAVSYPVGTSPEIEITYDGALLEVFDFPCIGLASTVVDQPGLVEVSVAADDFPYHVTGFVDDIDGGQCVVEHDSVADARVVDESFFVLEDQQICDGADIDVYAIDAVRGDEIDAYYDFDTGQSPLGMTLYAPSQQGQVGVGGGVVDADSDGGEGYLVHATDETGTYHVVVDSDGGAGAYDIATGRVCLIDDQFAGNHSFWDAVDVGIDSFGDLKLCDGTSDWYRYTHGGAGGASIAARVYVYHGDGEQVELTAYDDGGVPFGDGDDQGQGTTSIKESIIDVSPDDTIYFEVDAADDIIYELEIEPVGT